MDDLDDVDEIDDSRVCRCNYEEDEKNRKILVGYGILAETSVLTPIPRNTISLSGKEIPVLSVLYAAE